MDRMKCDMNNAAFFGKPEEIVDAWERYDEWKGGETSGDKARGLAEFCASIEISSALKYRIGEIVQVDFNGRKRYAKVTGYYVYSTGRKGLTEILVSFGAGADTPDCRYRVDPKNWDRYKAEIPPELLELARNEVLKAGACPFANNRFPADASAWTAEAVPATNDGNTTEVRR